MSTLPHWKSMMRTQDTLNNHAAMFPDIILTMNVIRCSLFTFNFSLKKISKIEHFFQKSTRAWKIVNFADLKDKSKMIQLNKKLYFCVPSHQYDDIPEQFQ